MKKEVIVMLLLGILLISPLVHAQEQSQTYSGFNRFIDNIKLFFSSGNKKVMMALEIREKELNSAISNLKSGEENKAKKEIESAINMLKIVQSKTTPEIADEVKSNVGETELKIKENENLNLEFFEIYLTEEQKTKLIIEHSKKIFEYCEELAKQDYELMLKDEKCQINAPDWLEDEVSNKIEEIQEQDSKEMKRQVEISMNNPKNADCDEISLTSERAKCEKFKALAIKCEFQDDESACGEISIFKDVQDDERENYEQEILNKYVPAECTEAGIRDGEECRKFIIALYRPDSECMKNGQLLDDESCGKKLVNEDKIPEECIQNGQPTPAEQCEKIMKEKSKPSDEEFKLMSGECKERGIYDIKACDEIVNLPRPCKDAGYYTKEECESFTLNQNLPQECIDASALTPEACEKLKLPQKCQGQAYSNEECEAVFIKEKMPPECQESGTYNFHECAKLLYAEVSDISIEGEVEYLEGLGISVDEIPDECFKDSSKTNFERNMDCDEALIQKFGIMLPPPEDTSSIPQECMRGGTPVSPEECEEILGNGIIQNDLRDIIPAICQEANVSTPEECGELLEEQRQEQGIGINMPEECIGLEIEECKEIMEEKNITIKKPEVKTEEICCKIEMVIAEPVPEYKLMDENECQVPEDWVGEMREIVSDEYCEGREEIECEIDFDCPAIMCITSPCPQYSCVDGECIIEREEEAECKSNDDCPTIMCEIPPCPQYFCINNKCIRKYEEVTIPKECAELGVYDKESCDMIMSKINSERIKDGDKVVIDDDGNTDIITNDQINQIADDADKKSNDIKPDTTKANDIKQQIDVIDDSIKTIDLQGPDIDTGNNVVDKPQMDKENEDVSPAPNIIDNDVAPGPEGIIGVVESQDGGNSNEESSGRESSGSEVSGEDSGGDIGMTGAAIDSGNKESFLGKILKGIFGI